VTKGLVGKEGMMSGAVSGRFIVKCQFWEGRFILEKEKGEKRELRRSQCPGV